jgi:hypothetical protein
MFPAGFEFQDKGFRIAGSPIGTDEYVCEFAEKKLAEAVDKLQAIKSLGGKCARATHRLLITCGTKLLTFLAATVPPCFMAPILANFDRHVDSIFFGTLSLSGFECSEERVARAKLRASLPAPFGCSLFRAADQGKAAWLSSVAASLSDPLFFELRESIRKFVEPAWIQLVEAIGGTSSKYFSQVSQVLPLTAEGFLDGSLFSPMNEFKVKISKVILKLLSRKRVESFFQQTSIEHISDTLSKNDVLRAQAQSLVGRIFTTSLRYELPFVFSNEQYLAWCSSFLSLPPANTLGNHTHREHSITRCRRV